MEQVSFAEANSPNRSNYNLPFMIPDGSLSHLKQLYPEKTQSSSLRHTYLYKTHYNILMTSTTTSHL